jgi:UDP-N-acetyl-D-galactosamine dehydrogenase
VTADPSNDPAPAVAVIGLGYVGLPLAVALARHGPVVGYDIDAARIQALRAGNDRTGEVSAAALADTSLRLSTDIADTRGADVFIVTVPTPVSDDNEPDLGAVRAASEAVGGVIAPGAVVVFESTVYPGVTEDVCGPILEAASGLARGRDFVLGYSPERINPGDTVHTVDKITKVVAAETPEAAAMLADLYGRMTEGGVHVAPSIKVAEAAKVIENAQRDINIAFVNEIALIFERMGIDTHAVLDAARTKWNFLDFKPGLVGGHCIGVDPFYLASAAQKLGHHPDVILSGRRINDAMGGEIARRISARLAGPGRVLALGLTFKENVPDLRNTKAVDVIRGLQGLGHTVDVHDAMADADEARSFYGLDLLSDLPADADYDAVVGLVPHAAYAALSGDSLARLLAPGGLVADIKGMWRAVALPGGLSPLVAVTPNGPRTVTEPVDFFSRYADMKGYHTPSLKPKTLRRFDAIFERAGCRTSDAVLEVGCGTGLFLLYLHAKGCERFQGIDFDPDLGPHIPDAVRDRFAVADAFAYLDAAEPGSLDAIFLFDVFEHFDVDAGHALLTQASRVLSDRGRIVLKMPNAASPWGGQYQFGDLTHKVAYTPSSIRQMAVTAGYDVADCFAHAEGSPVRLAGERLLHAVLNRVLTAPPDIWTANFVTVLIPKR